MRRVQVIIQKSVKEDDIYRLSDADQDKFIREVGEFMAAEMKERTMGLMPLGDLGYQVRGPISDPLQGLIHVHTLVAEYDMDRMNPEAPARLDWLASQSEENSGANLL